MARILHKNKKIDTAQLTKKERETLNKEIKKSRQKNSKKKSTKQITEKITSKNKLGSRNENKKKWSDPHSKRNPSDIVPLRCNQPTYEDMIEETWIYQNPYLENKRRIPVEKSDLKKFTCQSQKVYVKNEPILRYSYYLKLKPNQFEEIKINNKIRTRENLYDQNVIYADTKKIVPKLVLELADFSTETPMFGDAKLNIEIVGSLPIMLRRIKNVTLDKQKKYLLDLGYLFFGGRYTHPDLFERRSYIYKETKNPVSKAGVKKIVCNKKGQGFVNDQEVIWMSADEPFTSSNKEFRVINGELMTGGSFISAKTFIYEDDNTPVKKEDKCNLITDDANNGKATINGRKILKSLNYSIDREEHSENESEEENKRRSVKKKKLPESSSKNRRKNKNESSFQKSKNNVSSEETENEKTNENKKRKISDISNENFQALTLAHLENRDCFYDDNKTEFVEYNDLLKVKFIKNKPFVNGRLVYHIDRIPLNKHELIAVNGEKMPREQLYKTNFIDGKTGVLIPRRVYRCAQFKNGKILLNGIEIKIEKPPRHNIYQYYSYILDEIISMYLEKGYAFFKGRFVPPSIFATRQYIYKTNNNTTNKEMVDEIDLEHVTFNNQNQAFVKGKEICWKQAEHAVDNAEYILINGEMVLGSTFKKKSYILQGDDKKQKLTKKQKTSITHDEDKNILINGRKVVSLASLKMKAVKNDTEIKIGNIIYKKKTIFGHDHVFLNDKNKLVPASLKKSSLGAEDNGRIFVMENGKKEYIILKPKFDFRKKKINNSQHGGQNAYPLKKQRKNENISNSDEKMEEDNEQYYNEKQNHSNSNDDISSEFSDSDSDSNQSFSDTDNLEKSTTTSNNNANFTYSENKFDPMEDNLEEDLGEEKDIGKNLATENKSGSVYQNFGATLFDRADKKIDQHHRPKNTKETEHDLSSSDSESRAPSLSGDK